MDDETTAKVIDAAMRTIPTGAAAVGVGEVIKAALKSANWVVVERARISRLHQEMTTRHIAELQEDIEGPLSELQKVCSHPATKRHADPAGGSDSFTACLLCGKTW